jgi:hypothetical protein
LKRSCNVREKVRAARPAARTNGWRPSGYRSAEKWLACITGASISDATALPTAK